jgi:hypothetical protein
MLPSLKYKKIGSFPVKLSLLFVVFFLSSCATYYMKTIKFQEQVQQGNFDKAEKILSEDKRGPEGRNKILHFLNLGYVSWIKGEYEKSNQNFAKADQYIEDQSKNYGREALAVITNQSVKEYQPEDFEKVTLNYYKALNYLDLYNYDAALVECRKINNKLNSLNDKYKDHKNKYQRDAFSHTMMGLIYEANRDYNNAFIAYRNAYEVYKEDYVEYFGLGAPEQLKKDILRTAYLTGFYEEVRLYEKEFGIKYEHKSTKEPELIFFWLNGFGPVKSEWSINFTHIKGEEGWATFANEELGISVPIYIGDKNDDEKDAFRNLRFFRVAFPKYTIREPVYYDAFVYTANQHYTFEMAQNINEIAFKTLQDRMLREAATAALRVATKKALEALASEEDEGLGTLVSITNAITEKADTRNWQTLPYSISYSRIPLKKGANNLNFELRGDNGMANTNNIEINADANKIYFYSFHSIDSYPPVIGY